MGEPQYLGVAYPRLGLWVQELCGRHGGDDLAGGMSDDAWMWDKGEAEVG